MTWPKPEDYLDVFIRREWEKENGMTHTPGPWHVVWGRFDVQGPNHEFVAMSDNKNDQTRQANARLIAAAPELLEACKAALKFTQSSHDAGVDLDLLLARAIAKAEGHADTNL